MWVDTSLRELMASMSHSISILEKPFDVLGETATHQFLKEFASYQEAEYLQLWHTVISDNPFGCDPSIINNFRENSLTKNDIFREFNLRKSKPSARFLAMSVHDLPKPNEVASSSGIQYAKFKLSTVGKEFTYSTQKEFGSLSIDAKIYGRTVGRSLPLGTIQLSRATNDEKLGEILVAPMLGDWGPYSFDTKSDYRRIIAHCAWLQGLVFKYLQMQNLDAKL
jgi:hypothetical protein